MTLHDTATVDLIDQAVDRLRDGHVVLGAEFDYAAADLLEQLAELHRADVLNVEHLAEVRAFAMVVLAPNPGGTPGELQQSRYTLTEAGYAATEGSRA